MKLLFNHIKSDRVLFLGFTGSFSLLLITTVITILFYNRFPPFISLFNQMPWGDERLGTKEEIAIPLIVAFGIFIINILIASSLYKNMPLIARIFSITALLVCVFTLLFIIRTIQLIF